MADQTVSNGQGLQPALEQANPGNTISFNDSDAYNLPSATPLFMGAGPGTLFLDTNGNSPTIEGGGLLNPAAGGTAALDVGGDGTLTLANGINTYSGGTTIDSGSTLQLGGNTGSGLTSGSISSLGGVTDNGTLAFEEPSATGYSGAIAGSGGVSVQNYGSEQGSSVTLYGTNTYTGATQVTSATLVGGVADAFGTDSAVSLGGYAASQGEPTGIFKVDALAPATTGTLDLGGYDQAIGSLADGIGSTGSQEFVTDTPADGSPGATAGTVNTLTTGGNNTNTTFSGTIEDGAGEVALVKTGTGTQTLTGTNTYTGGTTVAEGTLQLGDDGTTGTIQGAVSTGAAATGTGTLAFSYSAPTAFTGAISGDGTIDVINGDVTLSGQNTVTGTTTIEANGAITAGAAGALSAASEVYFVGNFPRNDNGAPTETSGTLDLAGTNQTVGGLAGDAGTFDTNDDGGYSNASPGAGTVMNSGAGTARLTVDGTDAFANYGRSGPSFGGTITGAIALDVTGSLDLTGTNTYTGGTTIEQGGLLILDSAQLSETDNGGTADNNAQRPYRNGSVLGAIVDNGTLQLDQYNYDGTDYNGTPVTVANDIQGIGGVTAAPGALFYDYGTVVLIGNNTYTGATLVENGTLQGGVVNAFGTNSAVTVTGVQYSDATLDLDGNDQTIGSLAGGFTSYGQGDYSYTSGYVTNSSSAAVTLTVGGDNTSTEFDGNIYDDAGDGGGAIALTKVGTGTLTLGGRATYSGNTVISAGTLALTAGAEQAFVSPTVTFAAPGATLALAVPSTTSTDTGDGPKTIEALAEADAASASTATPLPGTTLNTFGPGDALDLRNLDFAQGATATLSQDGTTLQVVSNGVEQDFAVSNPGTTTFAVTDDGLPTTSGSGATADGTLVTAYALPSFSGVPAAPTQTTSEKPVMPFAGITVTDPNGGSDTVTIAVSGSGGTLAGTGLTKNPDGTYTVAATPGNSVTQNLDALTFTPTAGAPGTSSTTTFSLTDQSSVAAPATSGTVTTSVIDTAASRSVPTNDTVSLSQQVGYYGGTFLLSGTASSTAGVSSVEVFATVDPGPNGSRVDLGAATVNADGSFTIQDKIGANVQGFFQAVETDAAGGTATSTDPLFSLEGGLGRDYDSAGQARYTAGGEGYTAATLFSSVGSEDVHVFGVGQTFTSAYDDTFHNGAAPDTTFVFEPGHSQDLIDLFRVGGTDHDTLSFQGSDFGKTPQTQLGNLLRHTQDDGAGNVVITDPHNGDKVTLAGLSKSQLIQNERDITFHA